MVPEAGAQEILVILFKQEMDTKPLMGARTQLGESQSITGGIGPFPEGPKQVEIQVLPTVLLGVLESNPLRRYTSMELPIPFNFFQMSDNQFHHFHR